MPFVPAPPVVIAPPHQPSSPRRDMSTVTPGTVQPTRTPVPVARPKEIVTDGTGFYVITAVIFTAVMLGVVLSILCPDLDL